MSKTIIDLDIGVDDCVALLLALASPELDIVAITCVYGNTLVERVAENLNKTFHVLSKSISSEDEGRQRWPGMYGQKPILVGKKGADEPIAGEREVAAYFHGPDGLSNISETHPHFNVPDDNVHPRLQISPDSSASVILQTLKAEAANTVTLIALGPLTNLAIARREDPETFARVKRVLWMGAAIDAPGNTSPNAEFNLYADPYAGAEIFAASYGQEHPFSLIICPLDITIPHQIAFEKLLTLPPSPTEVDMFKNAFLPRVRTLYVSLGLPDFMEMHDPMVIWYAICLAQIEAGQGDSSRWATQRRAFLVERTGELTRGMCVIDRRATTETPLEIRSHGGIHSEKPATNGAVKKVTRGVDVVVETPGTLAFEAMFMDRVYGIKA